MPRGIGFQPMIQNIQRVGISHNGEAGLNNDEGILRRCW